MQLIFFFFQFLKTLDAREIYAQVLQHMPDLQILTKQSFEVMNLSIKGNNTGLILPQGELMDPERQPLCLNLASVNTVPRPALKLRRNLTG